MSAVDAMETSSTDAVVDLDYGEALKRAFRIGPESTRGLDLIAKRLLNVLIVTSQMGLCCVYVLFAAENILVRQ